MPSSSDKVESGATTPRTTVSCTVPVVLCIGGTDPSGGAGLPADARAAAAFGAHPCGVVTAVVAQNTRGAAHSEAVTPQLFRLQLETLLADIAPQAVKTGLLPSWQHVETVAELCGKLGVPLVVDTVFAPSTGVRFCDEDTVEAVRELLLPLAALVTPNRGEAETLCGFSIADAADAARAAQMLRLGLGARAVLLKGGHFSGADAVDILVANEETLLRAPRLPFEVRGTGCQLATAIAAQLAHGVALEMAAARAKTWLWQQMQQAMQLGGGRRVTRGEMR